MARFNHPQSEFNRNQAQWVKDVCDGKVALSTSTLEALETRSKYLTNMAQELRDKLVKRADDSLNPEFACFGTGGLLELTNAIEDLGRQRLAIDETAIPLVRGFLERAAELAV